jgi:hypothetical protein
MPSGGSSFAFERLPFRLSVDPECNALQLWYLFATRATSTHPDFTVPNPNPQSQAARNRSHSGSRCSLAGFQSHPSIWNLPVNATYGGGTFVQSSHSRIRGTFAYATYNQHARNCKGYTDLGYSFSCSPSSTPYQAIDNTASPFWQAYHFWVVMVAAGCNQCTRGHNSHRTKPGSAILRINSDG